MLELHERYVNFYTDFAFKKLFGTEVNKDLLLSFLNALLQGKVRIKDLKYINTENLGSQEFDRKAVFVVYCETEDGQHILVEIQKADLQYFYSAFPIRDQAVKGNHWDYRLNAVYTIGILNFSFDDDDPNYYHHEVKLVDTHTQKVFYDKLTYIYLEMPKFQKSEHELNSMFEKWLYAIKHLASLMERPAVLREKVFHHLFEQAEIARFNPRERMNYEESLKNYRDWYSVMKTAQIKGEAVGYDRGYEKGMEKGEYLKNIENARNLKHLGVDVSIISQATGLPVDEIERL